MLSDQAHWIDLERVAGTANDGEWAGAISLPQGAEVGLWTTQAGSARHTGNDGTRHRPPQPAAARSLLPRARQHGGGHARSRCASSGRSGERSTVTFPEGTVGDRVRGGPLRLLQDGRDAVRVRRRACHRPRRHPVATLRFGIPGLDLSFSRPVTVRMQVGSEYDGYLVQIQSLTETGRGVDGRDDGEGARRAGGVHREPRDAVRRERRRRARHVGLATQGAAHHAAHRARRRLRHAPRPQRGAVRRPRHQGLRRLDVHLLPLRHPRWARPGATRSRSASTGSPPASGASRSHGVQGRSARPAGRSGPTSLKPAARA